MLLIWILLVSLSKPPFQISTNNRMESFLEENFLITNKVIDLKDYYNIIGLMKFVFVLTLITLLMG